MPGPTGTRVSEEPQIPPLPVRSSQCGVSTERVRPSTGISTELGGAPRGEGSPSPGGSGGFVEDRVLGGAVLSMESRGVSGPRWDSGEVRGGKMAQHPDTGAGARAAGCGTQEAEALPGYPRTVPGTESGFTRLL